MRKYLIGLTALFALVVVTPVNAVYFQSGNDVMTMCNNIGPSESGRNNALYGKCLGYLAGVHDGDARLREAYLPASVCIPAGVTTEQLRQVYLSYMKKHPSEWHWEAPPHVMESFFEVWPCKEKK